MKIRTSFVSNSSTTSFILVGARLPKNKSFDMEKFAQDKFFLCPDDFIGLVENCYEEKLEDSLCDNGWEWVRPEWNTGPELIGRSMAYTYNDDSEKLNLAELVAAQATILKELHPYLPENSETGIFIVGAGHS